MCFAQISQNNLFNYQPLAESQAFESTRVSSQITPGTKIWAEKLKHIGNIRSDIIWQKWDKFPALLEALIKTQYSRHFDSDILQERIEKCKLKLQEIDLCVVGDILALHYDASASQHITPELKEKIKEIEATADLLFDTLSDIKKSDRIIHNEASQKNFFSKRMVVGIALSIVGMALAATAFVLPIAIPALVISAPLLLGALRGLGLLVSCTDGSLNIRDTINQCHQKSKKTESIEFTDAFAKLHDYLNEIKFIGITSLAARKAQSLNGHNALLPDTSEQQKSIQQEIKQLLEGAVQPLQAEIEKLKQQLNMQSPIVAPTPKQAYSLSLCPQIG